MSDIGDLQQRGSDVVNQQEGAAQDPTLSLDNEASSSATQGYEGRQPNALGIKKKKRLIDVHVPSSPHADHSDVNSPSPEASGLLSLPWEMVTHIASHLPAQCVISVLPKVCDGSYLAANN